MSNPCSVPRFLRLVIPYETEAQQAVCAAHDAAYAKGGSRLDRACADARFLLGLLETGMECDRAENYFWQVRFHGHTYWTGGDEPACLPTLTPDTQEAP
jgi:hypothetical protein